MAIDDPRGVKLQRKFLSKLHCETNKTVLTKSDVSEINFHLKKKMIV